MNIKENNIKILYMSHSNMWFYLEKLEEKNNNISVDYYKGSSYYLMNGSQYEDCDYIIFFSSRGYADFEEEELKKIANRISKEKEKRVTIGYSYIIPKEKRFNLLKQYETKIYSYNLDEEYEEINDSPEHFNPISLVELVQTTHNELENLKIKTLVKKESK